MRMSDLKGSETIQQRADGICRGGWYERRCSLFERSDPHAIFLEPHGSPQVGL